MKLTAFLTALAFSAVTPAMAQMRYGYPDTSDNQYSRSYPSPYSTDYGDQNARRNNEELDRTRSENQSRGPGMCVGALPVPATWWAKCQ